MIFAKINHYRDCFGRIDNEFLTDWCLNNVLPGSKCRRTSTAITATFGAVAVSRNRAATTEIQINKRYSMH